MKLRVGMAMTAAAMLVWLAGSAQAQATPSVDEIVKKTNHMAYYQGKDGVARVKMTITDKQGRARTKAFTILRMNKDEQDREQNFYVYFHEPADERGTTFMVHKHVGADDDRWLYLPALDLVKQIAASDERTSFVGSHFFYEDVSGRGTDEDKHELAETTDTYYVLKNTPKKPDLVEFDYYTMWIHKATFIPVKIAYTKGGEEYRVVQVLGVKDIQGYKTVVKSQIEDTKIGGKTVLDYETVKYDLGLPAEIFTERYLRKPPREYLE